MRASLNGTSTPDPAQMPFADEVDRTGESIHGERVLITYLLVPGACSKARVIVRSGGLGFSRHNGLRLVKSQAGCLRRGEEIIFVFSISGVSSPRSPPAFGSCWEAAAGVSPRGYKI